MDECCRAGKSSFFDENQGFRSEGLQKSENAFLVPPWRIENPLSLHAICMQCCENLLRFEARLIRQLAASGLVADFYLHGSTRQTAWIPTFWGVPKS